MPEHVAWCRDFLTIVLFCTILSGCGGEGPIEPGPDTGPVTACLDGEPFIASSAQVRAGPAEVDVTATAEDGRTIHFNFPNHGQANHLVGPGNPVSISVSIGASTWSAEEEVGSGAITVEGFTSSLLEGSFVFTVEGSSTPPTLTATNGRFRIIYLNNGSAEAALHQPVSGPEVGPSAVQ